MQAGKALVHLCGTLIRPDVSVLLAETLTLNCRQVLNLMVFFGFMFNYMLRVNLTIAIVEMVARANGTAMDNSTAVREDRLGGGPGVLRGNAPCRAARQ